MSKYLTALIIVLFAFISTVLYAGGLNSTSILFEVDNVTQIRNYTVIFVTVLIILFCLYKFKSIVNKEKLEDPFIVFKIVATCISLALFIMVIVIPYLFKNNSGESGKIFASRQDNKNICYTNIRKIQNAIEKYNLENYDKITNLNKEIYIKKILKKGYLGSIPECPGISGFKKNGFCYKNLGDLTKNGIISCGSYAFGNNGSPNDDLKYHGTINGSARKCLWDPKWDQYKK